MTTAIRQDPDFSSVAPVYRWLEFLVFGKNLQRTRCAFLQQVTDATNILILGDGDGRFTEKLVGALAKEPRRQRRIDFVDSSPVMVHLARNRLRKSIRGGVTVEFQAAQIETAQLRGPYDLVVTHFFLDCFRDSDLAIWVPRVLQQVTPQARWLVSEFAVPRMPLWRTLGQLLIRTMYAFFYLTARLLTTRLPDFECLFRALGLDKAESRYATGGLLVSQIWTMSPSPSEKSGFTEGRF